MHLKVRNVNQAFYELVNLFHGSTLLKCEQCGGTGVYEGRYTPDDPNSEWVKETCGNCDGKGSYSRFDRTYADSGLISRTTSRYGDVMVINEPVLVTYTHPRERVLLNSQRDCNPFFAVYESLWMLAGRNDVAPLSYYNSRMKEFSDDGISLNGAYGHRWRRAERYEWSSTGDAYRSEVVDQLDLLVEQLKARPDSRRAVLQMWNVEDDLLKIDSSKDVCCNTSVMFSLRDVVSDGANPPHPDWKVTERFLDMTVTNRSNDLVWGMLGANVVHFSFLQEYMAARLGAEVGVYNQFTNNLHCYAKTWEPERWLSEYEGSLDQVNRYDFHMMRLVKDPAVFEKELPIFVEQYSGGPMKDPFHKYTEPFLRFVAQPMMDAFLSCKKKSYGTMNHVDRIMSADWHKVAGEWLEKRLAKRQVSITEEKS